MLSGLLNDNDRFLAGLERIQERLLQAHGRISSGYKLERPSDSPEDVARVLEYSASLARTSQLLQNLEQGKVEADAAERAVASAELLLEQALAVAARGATGTLTATDRANLATEVEGLAQRLVAAANTQVQGRFLFSGDADQASPYSYDAAQPNGVTAYLGTAATRQFEDPNGLLFQVARSAQEIFDDPGGASVFAAVWSLRTALLANDPAAAANAAAALRGAHGHIARILGFYGSVQNRISAATETGHQQELQWKQALSTLRDADIVAESLNLSQLNLQREAALQSQARIGRRSLFDYLG